MKTTTVRFDHRSWGEIERHCETLGIAHAAFIRDAVIERLARLDHVDRLAVLEARLDDQSPMAGGSGAHAHAHRGTDRARRSASRPGGPPNEQRVGSMKTMTVRLNDELWAALRVASFIDDRHMSEIIRAALIAHLHARCDDPVFGSSPLAASVIAAIR